MPQTELIKEIEERKRERNAVILAHVYQIDDIQRIADFTGDSLDLSRKAIDTDAEVIVFCGARFMAETAAILNPYKTVLLPDEDAGCPLADMITVEELRAKRKEYPNAAVVSYVNSSAAVKAESDICCTSSNAVKVVDSLEEEQVIFVPDRNLGRYVASQTDKDIVLWDGFCYVHNNNIRVEDIERMKLHHPEAKVMVHPECQPEVIDLADYVGSTAQMLKYASETPAEEYIVGTERGLLYRLRQENPDKKSYSPSGGIICEDMKKITLEKVAKSLENMLYKVEVPMEISKKAKRALDRMLEI